MIRKILFAFITLPYIQAVDPTSRYVVQLTTPSILAGGKADTIKAAQTSFNACLLATGINSQSNYYNDVFKDIDLTSSDLANVTKCPQVLKVTPGRIIQAPVVNEGGPVRPMHNFNHIATGVQKSRETLGLSGKGIKNTGVDYTHPAFGTCTKIGDEGCAFQFGYDFVGNTYDGTNTPTPSNDPMDCLGHGTHVSGIIAGNDVKGNVIGVAPNVQLGMYRVFSCQGGTTAEIVIQAMRKAYEDGMDIINISLGNDGGFADSPESLVVEELSKLGVIFSVAMGNQGATDGNWMVADPAVSNSATAVSSFVNSEGIRRKFTLGNDKKEITFDHPTPPGPNFNVLLGGDIDPTATGVIASYGCEAPKTDVKGKVVLILRGNCDVGLKTKLLKSAGAIGVILANNNPGDIGPMKNFNGIPIFTISQADGLYLAQLQKSSGQQLLAFTQVDFTAQIEIGANVSPFSTWGIGQDLQIKPDFGAPGSYIYSSYLKGGYKVISGTSMSAPYIAGCYALFLEQINIAAGSSRKYSTDPILLREIFTIYASAMDRLSDPAAENAISVPKQGGGLIQVDRALLGLSRLSPAKLSVGVLPVQNAQTIKITNSGSEDRQYTIRLKKAVSVEVTNSIKPTTLNSSSTATFSSDGANYQTTLTIIVKAQADADIYCGIFPDQALDTHMRQYLISGYIEVSVTTLVNGRYIAGARDYLMSVPYAGLQGDPKEQIVIDNSQGRTAALTWQRGSNDLAVGTAATPLSIQDFVPHTDFIKIDYRLMVPVQSLQLILVSKTGSVLGMIHQFNKVRKNYGSQTKESGEPNTGFMSTFYWDTRYTDLKGAAQIIDSAEYDIVIQYVTLQLIGMNEGISGSFTLPSIAFQFTDAAKADYIATANPAQ